MKKEAYIEAVIDAVAQRDPIRQQPVYLENLGGCGSHWISRMMAQASDLIDAGEVYLPPDWYSRMSKEPTESAARILDGVELAHSVLFGGVPGEFPGARLINSAHGCEKIHMYRKLRPLAKVIHLIRRPRDRTLSVAFRKHEFRQYEAAEVEDLDYLLSKAERSLSHWRRYKGQKDKADMEIRYEDVRANTSYELRCLLQGVGIRVSEVVAEAVAHRNSPEFLKNNSGGNSKRGNLNVEESARTSHDMPTKYNRIIHSIVAPALVGQDYPLCDCFPDANIEPVHPRDGLAAAIRANHGQIRMDAQLQNRTTWRILSGREDLHMPLRLRVRMEEPVPSNTAFDLLRPWITDICMAGSARFDDEAIDKLGPLPALQALDVSRTGVTKIPQISTQMPALKYFNYSGSTITARGADLPPGALADY